MEAGGSGESEGMGWDAGWVEETKEWYESLPASAESMLNGLMHVHGPDVAMSTKLLEDEVIPLLPAQPLAERCVLDCGAGVGRVTKAVLAGHFDAIDLVDISQKQLDGSREYLAGVQGVRERYQRSLTELELPSERLASYDVIWAQWVVCHLPDNDFVKFLLDVRHYIKPDGYLVVIDNTFDQSEDPGFIEFYEEDHVILRHPEYIQSLMALAGWVPVIARRQQYPGDICPVWAFVLKMKDEEKQEERLDFNTEEEEEEEEENNKESTLRTKESKGSQDESVEYYDCSED